MSPWASDFPATPATASLNCCVAAAAAATADLGFSRAGPILDRAPQPPLLLLEEEGSGVA